VVLWDEERRVSALGGREGMARSLRPELGRVVTRFLGGSVRGIVARVIPTRGVLSYCNGFAVSNDGSTLLLSNWNGCTAGDAVREYTVADGAHRRSFGSRGDGLLQFNDPCQVWIASDDCIFIADRYNKRVQVLTPTLDFHGFVGVGYLKQPVGVCANTDVVVVSDSETIAHHIAVFSRHDGALLRRFGSDGGGNGQLRRPSGLCLLSGDRLVAVAEGFNSRVSVFSVDGEFIHHVGVGVLKCPHGVACSAYGELVVADTGNRRAVVFCPRGQPSKAMGGGEFTGVAVRSGTIFAQDCRSERCVVFE
jgi:DNA-binding beta-propeller fold protein YncE